MYPIYNFLLLFWHFMEEFWMKASGCACQGAQKDAPILPKFILLTLLTSTGTFEFLTYIQF